MQKGIDLQNRLAYNKAELLQVLPFGKSKIDELLEKKLFPAGVRPHPSAHPIWPKSVVLEWLANLVKGAVHA